MDSAQREAIRERLQQIADANGGLLTPDAVVEDARDKTSPLHGQFTWNQKRAAYERWLDQARALIRTVRIEILHEETMFKAPYWLHDPDVDQGDQGYRSSIEIRSNEDKARAAVYQECARAAGAIRRARDVAVSLGLQSLMEKVLKQIEAAQEKVRKAA